jgi:hypothetical protein
MSDDALDRRQKQKSYVSDSLYRSAKSQVRRRGGNTGPGRQTAISKLSNANACRVIRQPGVNCVTYFASRAILKISTGMLNAK